MMKMPPWNTNTPHISVLYNEVIQAINPMKGGYYVDATLGLGGHAWGILESSRPDGRLLGLDVDLHALELAGKHLADFADRVTIRNASYVTLKDELESLNWPKVNGIVIDLGVSSLQLDTAERGFSFLRDGPLDMRFSTDQPSTAADLINHLSENELSDLIWRYGDEVKHRKIARAIHKARPIQTTRQLAEIVSRAVSAKGRQRVHPATRTFQAIRIAVNQELAALEAFLPQAIEALAPQGMLAVITFHSLEDRIVKQFFRSESRDCICPPEQPVCTCNHKAVIKSITRRPIVPDEQEIERNSRARSAHLRIAQKLPDNHMEKAPGLTNIA